MRLWSIKDRYLLKSLSMVSVSDFATYFRTQCESCVSRFTYLVQKKFVQYGTKFAVRCAMNRIIEFPKGNTKKEAPEASSPPPTRKILNIADWSPKLPLHLHDPGPDHWPYCAA